MTSAIDRPADQRIGADAGGHSVAKTSPSSIDAAHLAM
jgi:hypothetical protein